MEITCTPMNTTVNNQSNQALNVTARIEQKHRLQHSTRKQMNHFHDDNFISDVPFHHLTPNREFVTLIWFDPMLTKANIDLSMIDHLRRLTNYILFYTQKSMCMEYLTSNMKNHDHLIVILHGSEIFDRVCACEQVHTILIVDSNMDQNKLDVSANNHQMEIFPEQHSMMIKLQQVIMNVEDQITEQVEDIFNTFDRKERALRDLQSELVPFLWCSIFKITVKAMPHSLDARQQMIDECRSYYQNNSRELAVIDEFEQTYRSTDAIQWYTRSCFLYRLINKALRTGDIITLHTFRYFITDLCANLEIASHEKYPKRVYRGSILHRDEVEKYRIGHLVATNGFLSSSRDLQVAQMFCGLDPNTGISPSRSRDNERQYVLFEIDIDDSESSNIILADITTESIFPHENEILFDMGTTFEIISTNYDCEHYFWHIQMKTSSEIVHLNQQYKQYIDQQMKETNVSVLFGLLLTDMGEYTQSLKYFEYLLARLSSKHEDRPNIYYSMARVYRFIGKYSIALKFLRRAEHLQRLKLPESKFDLARILAGIGSVYYELHDYQRELLYYKYAIIIYRQILPENHIEMARSLNRLGFAYINQQSYTCALHCLTQSLTIYKKLVPDNYPGIGQTLSNIGIVHHALQHIDETLDFYQKALQNLEKVLPEEHLHIAFVCYRLSMFHDEQQQFELAFLYAQRSLNIREKKLSYDHYLIHEAKNMVERLQSILTTNNL